MNRRGFFKAVIASTATVAIGLRMAQAFPTPVPGSRVRSDVVGPYRYFMDLDDPLDVSVYYETDVVGEYPIPLDHINEEAHREHNFLYNPEYGGEFYWKDNPTEAMQLVAEISVSQGMADYRSGWVMGQIVSGEMEDAVSPRISMIAHGVTY